MDVVVNLAPTGMVPTKADTMHVPLFPAEIVRDVLACAQLGITSVHLHARDEDGRPTYKKEIYAEMIGEIRAVLPDLVVCVSTSGRNFPELEKRADALDLDGDLKPDMASLTLSSLNFAHTGSMNEPKMVQALAERMRERGIKPELEVFDLGMANYAHFLLERGYLEGPLYFNVLLGNVASAQANPLEAGVLLNALPAGSIVSLAGLGNTQLPMNAMSIACGTGVRVGLEDNIWYDAARTRLATNRDLVQRVVTLAGVNGRDVMTSADLRSRLALQPVFV